MAVVSKSLHPQKPKGYQFKDIGHTFHLILSGILCDHWSGYRDALKTGPIQGIIDGFLYLEAAMAELPTKCVVFWSVNLKTQVD